SCFLFSSIWGMMKPFRLFSNLPFTTPRSRSSPMKKTPLLALPLLLVGLLHLPASLPSQDKAKPPMPPGKPPTPAELIRDAVKELDAWIPKLIATLVTEEIPGGGWNYAGRKQHASFVTAPVVQALLLARAQGEKVPEEVLQRARKALETSRTQEGAFLYSGIL